MDALKAAILGVVEGLTEYLPVSSTGHLIIASALMNLDEPGPKKDAINAFTIVIQGGAILAVLGLYRHRVAQMIRGLLGKDAAGLKLAINIIIAFLPAAVFGVLLASTISEHLFYHIPVMSALAVGGIIMIFIGRWQRRFFRGESTEEQGASSEERALGTRHSVLGTRAHTLVNIEHLTWRRALLIGLLQCIAMWPGTSRSMVTIVGGMLVGLRPRQAAEFSFLLGLPTLGGACIYSGITHHMSADQPMWNTLGWQAIIIGFAVATISAAFAIKWLVSFLTRHGLAIFGWYRLILCAVLGVLIWRGVVSITPQDAKPVSPDRLPFQPN